MEWNQETLQNLSQCFLRTLSPNPKLRRDAVSFLADAAERPNYGLAVLRLLAEPLVDDLIRQAAAVNFKNHLRSRWAPSSSDSTARNTNTQTQGFVLTLISDSEKDQIKSLIVQLMLQSSPEIQSQLSEPLAVIGKHDFPNSWPGLLTELVSNLRQATGYSSIIGILRTVNSIFKKFRCQNKTPQLSLDLTYCIDRFAAPLFETFLNTSALMEPDTALQPVFELQRLCCRIFYSLNFQEFSDYFKDHMGEWMMEFLNYLTTNYPSLEGSYDGLEVVSGLRAAVCENINLYMQKNEEEFQPYLEDFVKVVWKLLIDVPLIVSSSRERFAITAIKFFITISKSLHHTLLSGEILTRIWECVVIPNVRLSKEDEELFEMNYVEFIRRDMEGSDIDTRRRIACELLKGLAEKYEDQVNIIVGFQIECLLKSFDANPAAYWREKDFAIYLVVSLATKKAGGSSMLTDFIEMGAFFDNVIVPELQSQYVNGFPMLKAGSLNFLSMVRNQIPKHVAISLMPYVVRFLQAESNVVQSYASIYIEKLLLVKEVGGQPRYTSSDISPFLLMLMTNLFDALKFPESEDRTTGKDPADLPRARGRNPYIMKCIMRVLGVADISGEVTGVCITGLTSILNEVCKNPMNPIFNHYLFEAVASLVRRACEKDISLISTFEASLFPIIQAILANAVTEFLPYAFQLVAQLVELSRPPLHQNYMHVFELLLSPDVWKKSANVPALVGLLQAFLRKAPHELNQQETLSKVLGIFNKLVSVSSTEDLGFYVLNTVIENLGNDDIQTYVPYIWNALFTRPQNHYTVKFVKSLVIFMSLFLIKHGSATLVDSINAIQPNGYLFATILDSFWAPNLKLITGTIELKLASVASTRLICEFPGLLDPAAAELCGKMLDGIVTLLSQPEQQRVDEEPDVPDIAETVGYAATFVHLHNAGKKDEDPLKEIRDPKEFFVTSLASIVPQMYPTIIQQYVDTANQQALSEFFTIYNPSPELKLCR